MSTLPENPPAVQSPLDSGRRPSQVKASTCSSETILRHPNFVRGLADIRAGRPFADDADDRLWAYERGRLFGAIAPRSMRLFDGKQLNPKALQLFSAASDRGSMKIRRDIELITTELQAALKRKTTDIIAIGDLLLEAQEHQLEHGEWLPWLKEHFELSIPTAENYIAAARLAAKFVTVTNLNLRPTVLYRLGKGFDDPSGLFNHKAIEAILKAAETQWINVAEAHAIAKSLQPSKTLEAILAQPFNEARGAE